MIPIIVLSIIILSVKIKTSNLESIISSPVQKNASLCYNLTNSFINEQKSDERYLSLHSYLKSFTPVCIVIIIIYFIKIIFSACIGMIFEEDVPDAMLLLYINLPGRILSFIPSIVCVIILIIKSFNKKCELFMNYYDLCSPIYGDDFKNNFSNIMHIKIYASLTLIFFIAEIVYHAIIFRYILRKVNNYTI